MGLEAFLAVARCVQCQASGLQRGESQLICPHCSSTYPIQNGVIDFVREDHANHSLTQKLMDNKSVVSVYEKYVRPSFIRLGAPLMNYQKEEAWLRENVPVSSDVVIDIACGTGRYTRFLCEHAKPQLVVAVDLSQSMLEESVQIAENQGLNNIVHVRADAAYLPLQDDSIDIVLCMAALHLFEDVTGAVKDMTRIARDQARFACLTAQSLAALDFMQRFFDQVATFQFFRVNELQDQLESLGHSEISSSTEHMALFVRSQINKINCPN